MLATPGKRDPVTVQPHTGGKYPGDRTDRTAQSEVRGRKPEPGSEVAPMAYPPADAEAPPEERNHRIEPPDREHIADPGAADPISLNPVRIPAMDVESMTWSGRAEQFDVPLRLVAETEIVTDGRDGGPRAWRPAAPR